MLNKPSAKYTPLVSVVIPCYNSHRYIEPCLDSILQYKTPSFEIIIIDDGSSDKTPNILEKYKSKKNIRIYTNAKNKGPAICRNFGVSKSKGRYILFLDIDTVLQNNCISHIAERFTMDPKIGIMQLKILNRDKITLETAGHFLSFLGLPYEIGVDEPADQFCQEKSVFGARSAALSIRASLFRKIGGFDEDYIIYGEETDLCWRSWIAGYKTIFYPDAWVVHYHKSSLSEQTYHRIFLKGLKTPCTIS
jgi:GT2 family glycosyltransferase